MFDQEKIQQATRLLLEAIGEDPQREGVRASSASVFRARAHRLPSQRARGRAFQAGAHCRGVRAPIAASRAPERSGGGCSDGAPGGKRRYRDDGGGAHVHVYARRVQAWHANGYAGQARRVRAGSRAGGRILPHGGAALAGVPHRVSRLIHSAKRYTGSAIVPVGASSWLR